MGSHSPVAIFLPFLLCVKFYPIYHVAIVKTCVFSNSAGNLQHFEGSYMSVALNKKLAHFHDSTVFTLKIHKNDLEKNCIHSQVILICSNWTYTLPLSPCQRVFPISPDLLFYRLTKYGTFHFFLVILSHFL